VRFLTYDQIRDLLEKLRGGAKINRLVKPDGAQQAPPPADAPTTPVHGASAQAVAAPAQGGKS
jgi:peptidyl-prolyl cis-trans isomerase C